MGKKVTTEDFITKAKEIHRNRYDYSKTVYSGRHNKLTIICPKHGPFEQEAGAHLSGCGCPQCGREAVAEASRSNTDEFIKKAREVHGDRYDYSKVDYKGSTHDVIIICKEHGEFKQRPAGHLNGQGCQKCAGNYIMTTEEFISKAKEVHGNTYDYSKVNYINSKTEVDIVCDKHGLYRQLPHLHLNGCGCSKCGRIKIWEGRKKTTEDFIREAKEIHGDTFSYEKTEYVDTKTKVIITCKIHGDFEQYPNNHLRGHGCDKCARAELGKRNSILKKGVTPSNKVYNKDFIERAKKIHGNKFSYEPTNYRYARELIVVRCNECGRDFNCVPTDFVKPDYSCPLCNEDRRFEEMRKQNYESFIRRAIELHNGKYDYSNVEYVNATTPVCIICHEKDEFGREHGPFWQTPQKHLSGHGCVKCSRPNEGLTTEEFIEKAKLIHGDKYDYSKVEYVNISTPVCIICKKHGPFWQAPVYHLDGKGCSKCNSSRLESELLNFFTDNGIKFETQKKFKWLKNKTCLPLDFYLPDFNVGIECQGEQHFKPVDFFGGEDAFEYRKEKDTLKKTLCESHGVKLLYFTSDDIFEQVFDEYKDITYTSTEKLIEVVKNSV